MTPNFEPRLTHAESRLDRIEASLERSQQQIEANALNISDLRSTVATLANLIGIQQEQAEADRQQVRALIDAIDRRFHGNGNQEGI